MAASHFRSRTHSNAETSKLQPADPPQRRPAPRTNSASATPTLSSFPRVTAAGRSHSPQQPQSQYQNQHQQPRQLQLQQQHSYSHPSPTQPSSASSEGTFLLPDDPPVRNVRDSFASIVDDPFFQRFHEDGTVDAVAHGAPSDHDESSDEPSSSGAEAWPPPRRESLIISPTSSVSSAVPKMDTINIAVIGADGVGKSAFIQRALRLPRPPTTNVTGMRIEVEGAPCIVSLIELDLEHFDFDPTQKVRWPKQINGHMVPVMDGALILYDVMNRESIKELPATLSALGNSGLPTILVATKCDNPENSRQLSTEGIATAFPSVISDFKTSSNVPGSNRDCLQAIIRAAVSNRRGADRAQAGATSRRRAASSAAHLDTPQDTANGRAITDNTKHSRASSDLSLLRGFPSVPSDRESYYRSQNSRSPRPEMPNAPQLTMSSFGTEMTDENTTHSVSGMLRTPGVRLDSGSGQDASFLDVEESDAESYRYSDDIPILQRNDEVYDKPAKMTGVTFDELVDRLLAPRMTKADANFAEVFLCLYRKFAAPSQLFSAILSRLDAAKNETGTPYLLKTTTQLRIIEAVARWVSAYPGDFARPATRRRLEELIQNLSTDPVFALAAAEMHMQVDQNVVEDDDTGWANSDETKHDSGHFTDILDDARRGSEISESLKSLHGQETRSSDFRPSLASDLATMELESGGHVARFEYHTLEDYEREAATMVPTATLPLNKIRYHIFMDLDADDVADEITRIDWVMFSSIRIRDFVRHVSLSLEEKERCKSLKNVNRMISHFNHVAKWVSNMILIRDKAKHRAPCLQKFMLIALKLRQLNNYNGLAAVLAGINGTAVHRLAQTRALVDQDVQKRFARLGLLMGTQKSHFAYRLAWENSPLPRIPFIPLHRRDLVSAEEGSRTFVGPQGDRINWKKFEVLGEVILPIMKSQGTAYPNLKRHNLSRELILDCRMPTDEEEIYQRSLQVEPTGAPAESSRKKFPWLPK